MFKKFVELSNGKKYHPYIVYLKLNDIIQSSAICKNIYCASNATEVTDKISCLKICFLTGDVFFFGSGVLFERFQFVTMCKCNTKLHIKNICANTSRINNWICKLDFKRINLFTHTNIHARKNDLFGVNSFFYEKV